MLWRQGDVLIESIEAIPPDAELREGPPALAYGEATGHSYRNEPAGLLKLVTWLRNTGWQSRDERRILAAAYLGTGSIV